MGWVLPELGAEIHKAFHFIGDPVGSFHWVVSWGRGALVAYVLKKAVSLCERPPLWGSEWELLPTTKILVVAFGGLRQELGHNGIVIG